MTVPPSRPRRYQNSWPNPAGSLAFCASGWRVTWPLRDPTIPALSGLVPATCAPRVARDKAPVARSPSHAFAPGTVAAAHARRRERPARAQIVAGAQDDGAADGDTSGYRPSGFFAPSLRAENTLGTPCTALNNHAASTDLPHASVHLSRRTLSRYGRLPALASAWVSLREHPRVNFGERRSIDYLIDSQNRRVAKKINGTVVRKWIYKNQLRPAAEFDGAGTLVARYTGGVLIKGTTSYRVIADNLGTPRLLVTSTNGAVVQRMDIDEWGQVTADSSAGLQVVGFAGGIYDPDTGLVRFGARDYDPATGRWTVKDPIGFEGGEANLYGYILRDPINQLDRNGLIGGGAIISGTLEGGILIGGMGATGSAGMGVFTGGSTANCPCGTHAAPGGGEFASGGAFAGSPLGGASYPGGETTGNGVLGLTANAGAGLFFTNASAAADLGGSFDTWSLSTPFFTIQIGFSGDTWMGSATIGPGVGYSLGAAQE